MSNENNFNEQPIAKVRNLMSPMVTYFLMKEELNNGEVPEHLKSEFLILLDDAYNQAVKTMPRLLDVVKDDKLWTK